jgi:predicted RNase H-like HicB family nuclease
MRYAVVIEKANGNYSAYVPDLPGCVATGETVEAVEREIRAAMRFHIEGLRADGLEVPAATSIADYVDASSVPLSQPTWPDEAILTPRCWCQCDPRSRVDSRA